MNTKKRALVFGLILSLGIVAAIAIRYWGRGAGDQSEIVVGLVAAQSGAGALSGEAIQRGLEAAIGEVNANGGLLGGRKLRLVVRDDEGNPSKGTSAARELITNEKAVAIFGGFHSPVSLAMLETFHELKTPYIGTWAAATAIIRNGKNPNYMFRVSANDDLVDSMLVDYAIKVNGSSRIGLILEKTPWGESNNTGLTKYLQQRGLTLAGVEWFMWQDPDMTPQLLRLRRAGADGLIMIANAQDGATIMQSLAKISWDVKVVSHWGIAGGRFPELAGADATKVPFLQTYSFIDKKTAQSERLVEVLKAKYKIKGPEEILVPSAVANAYDALHLLAEGIKVAGRTDGPSVREGLLKIERYEGLIKTYMRPFADDQEALDASDYIMARWQDGKIMPVTVY
jgi:branched-chain amino acid transport system substrate-binding protein